MTQADIIKNMGFESLNPLQQAMVDSLAPRKMLLAPTGAGKTFGFLLPVVLQLYREQGGRVMVIAPSRELALQIDEVVRQMKTDKKVTCCYGGHSVPIEKRSLDVTPDFIVGTPGRLLDHLQHSNIDGTKITHLIFDEFDKLLEMGFEEEMRSIVELLPSVEFHTLTSATNSDYYPPYIEIGHYEKIDFLSESQTSSGQLTVKRVSYEEETKRETLIQLLCNISDDPAIVFCNFREEAESLASYLNDNEIPAEFFHGGQEQFDREKSLTKFRNGSCNLLISTDLASRGLDIPDIKHIIHYALPNGYDAFVHRNGRTARVDKEGIAYMMVSEKRYDGEKTGAGYDLSWIDKIEGDFFEPKKGLPLPPLPFWTTVYLGKGKKDKLSRVDIVGFFCQKGGIVKADIGKIELKDNHSFVALRWDIAKDTVHRVRDEKIKNMKAKISLSY